VKPVLTILKTILGIFLAFFRLFYQSIYLALGQIWVNKTRSILTTLGIVIGVASVTAVIAALTGLKARVLTQVETLGTNTIFIQPGKPGNRRPNEVNWWQNRFLPRHFEGMLEHCPSIAHVCRISGVGQRTIKYLGRSVDNVQIMGIESTYHEIEHRPILLGRTFSPIDDMQVRQVCLIDPKLRDRLLLDRDCIGETIRIGYRAFVIVGIIESRPKLDFDNSSQERGEIFLPYRTVYKLGDAFMVVLAAGKSPQTIDEAVEEIRFFLRRTRNIGPGQPDNFRVDTVRSALDTINRIAAVVTLVAGSIVAISLLVGGVGIMNIMLVSVSERTREIGLRKAVGAKRSAILTQFMIESVTLCFVGGLVGVGFGQLLTMAIANIPQVKLDLAHIPLWAIGLSFAFAGVVGIFFGMFPAIKAARLDPIEALRHE
jgi:putative ABC transport system permease protein